MPGFALLAWESWAFRTAAFRSSSSSHQEPCSAGMDVLSKSPWGGWTAQSPLQLVTRPHSCLPYVAEIGAIDSAIDCQTPLLHLTLLHPMVSG